MPAASAEKKARQRANKLLRRETETGTALSNALPPVQTAEITSEFLPAPTPDILLSPATPTCQLEAFRTFIKFADFETINSFLTTATSLPGSENLKALWDRAFNEGYERCSEKLNTQHEERIQHALSDVYKRQQEWRDDEYVRSYYWN